MAGPDLPELPATLKSIHPYLKIASDHDQRDVVVSYWCRLYALQAGLKIKKTPEDKMFLIKLMDWLEAAKKAHHENEAITNDIAAQAHVENYALKLFLFADKNDRASNFNKSVIQAFFTAGLLYDVLSTFGELSDEAAQNKKYAKWKAAYIHNCLKNGETPVPGPAKDEEDDSNENISSPAENEEYGDDDSNAVFGPDTQPMQPQPMQPMQPTLPVQPTPPANMGAFDFPSVPVDRNEDTENPEGNEGIDETESGEGENPETSVEEKNDDADESNQESAVKEDNEDNVNEETPAEVGDDQDVENNEEESAANLDEQDFGGNGESAETQDNQDDDNNDEESAETQDNQDDDNNDQESEPHPYNPAPTPTNPGANSYYDPDNVPVVPEATGGVHLSVEQNTKAQKYIKWAGSALNYDDVPTAISNLKKALHLLSTGEDIA